MEPLLLTPAEAARSLGIGRSKLYELLSAGVIASIRIGNCRRVSTVALVSFVENQKGRTADGQRRGAGPAA